MGFNFDQPDLILPESLIKQFTNYNKKKAATIVTAFMDTVQGVTLRMN